MLDLARRIAEMDVRVEPVPTLADMRAINVDALCRDYVVTTDAVRYWTQAQKAKRPAVTVTAFKAVDPQQRVVGLYMFTTPFRYTEYEGKHLDAAHKAALNQVPDMYVGGEQVNAMLSDPRHRVADLRVLCVPASHKGLGRLLLLHAFAEMDKQGVRSVFLQQGESTEGVHEGASRLYDAFGFEPIDLRFPGTDEPYYGTDILGTYELKFRLRRAPPRLTIADMHRLLVRAPVAAAAARGAGSAASRAPPPPAARVARTARAARAQTVRVAPSPADARPAAARKRKRGQQSRGAGKAKAVARRTRTRNADSFTSSTRKVLKQVHPDTSISKKAVDVMDGFTRDTLERIVREAAMLAMKNDGRKTITARDIETATRLVLPASELARHAVTEGQRAVAKYNASAAIEP